MNGREVSVWFGDTLLRRTFKRIKSANYVNNKVGEAYQEGKEYLCSFDSIEMIERSEGFPVIRRIIALSSMGGDNE